jgi:hypothetical protein
LAIHTFCVGRIAALVEPDDEVKLLSPEYVTVICVVPRGRLEVAMLATPLTKPGDPRPVPPAEKVAVPVGVPVVLLSTVAVRVTDVPNVGDPGLTVTEVLVPAFETVREAAVVVATPHEPLKTAR